MYAGCGFNRVHRDESSVPMSYYRIVLIHVLIVCLAGISFLPQSYGQGSNVHKIVLEAEDFRPSGHGGWKAIRDGDGNYMVDIIGASHISGGMLLSAPASAVGAKAVLDTDIPAAGMYKIWARYEAPLKYNCIFDISVVQGGHVVFQHEYGRSGALKLWYYGGGFKPWIDWAWGSEGLVSEGYTGTLKQGHARIILTAPFEPPPAANRNVDFILLTTDTSDTWIKDKRYAAQFPELDYILKPGRAFVKLTNEGSQPCYFNLTYSINRIPWWRNVGIAGAEGLLTAAPIKKNPFTGWIKPHDSTPWIDVSYGDTCHPAHLWIRQIFTQQATGMDFEASVAGHAKKALKTVSFADPAETTMDVEIPPYPEKDPNGIKTAYQIVRSLDAYVKRLPAIKHEPRKTLFFASFDGFVPGAGTRMQKAKTVFLRDLGINTFGGDGDQAMLTGGNLAAMRKSGYTPVKKSILWGAYTFPPTDANIARLQQWYDTTPYASDYLLGVYFGDEVGPLSLALSQHLPVSGFPAYLESKGMNPKDFMTDGKVKPEITAAAAASNPKLYVESYLFTEHNALAWMKQQTDKIRKRFGSSVVIGSNYSPHAYFWPIVADYVNAFRFGGLSFAQEDDYFWQVGEITSQVDGYLTDVFRSGLFDTPHALISNYVMPHCPGNTDADFRLTCYENWIHGGKALDFFDITPPFGETENYISEDCLSRYKEIHDIIGEAGAVDNLLHDGTVESDPVAIYLSESTQIWDMAKMPFTTASTFGDKDSGLMIAYNEEMKCLWYALRHGHIQPDFLVRPDLTSRLNNYRVLYVVGDHLSAGAAQAIAAWVKNGGTLFAVAGGGFLDQFNQPLTTLDKVYGISAQTLTKKDVYIRSKIELPRLRPLDVITAGNVQLPALAFKQTFTVMPGTDVLGRFKDGSPAFIRHAYGKGEAYLLGTLPSLYYVQQALLPLQPPDRGPYAHFHPFDFNPQIRNLILTPVTQAHIVPNVNVSTPLVETNKLASSDGILLPVANYGPPVHQASFAVRCQRKIASVRSLAYGSRAFSQKNGIVIFSLPVDLTDFIVLTPARKK